MNSITLENLLLIGKKNSLQNKKKFQRSMPQNSSKISNSSQNILSLMYKQSHVNNAIAFKGIPLPKGFDSIVGYNDIKQDFKEYFINKLDAEKEGQNVKMPNGILFFGTTDDNRKNDLAKALAEETDCNIIKIDHNGNHKQYIKNIFDEAKFARQSYEDNYPRTIILLNDFDRVLDAEQYLKSKLQNLLNGCGDKFKTTLFMTTNLSPTIGDFDSNMPLIAHHRISKRYFVGSE